MHGVGFEPTSIATPHLECGPLDRSGIRASPMYSYSYPIYKTTCKTLPQRIFSAFTLLNEFYHLYHQIYIRNRL